MAEESERPFEPISFDLILNSPEANAILSKLIAGEIKILRLFQCEPPLFQRVQEEIMGIVTHEGGQALEAGHPTFHYIKKWDPQWTPKPGTIYQYSLLNSKHDLRFFEEDHHWFPGRSLNPQLRALQEFFTTYFGASELQNCRVQAIAGGGELGQHRERIVAIPNREHHYKLRFHLPIVTNPGVRFLMDGQSSIMDAGWVYLFNQFCMHGVMNEGSQLRVHVVWDCYLNEHIVNQLMTPALQVPA